jgi:hypothetical protein
MASHVRLARATARPREAGHAHEEAHVSRFTLRRPILISPLAALVAQLLLAAAASAVTGGGDFPLRR